VTSGVGWYRIFRCAGLFQQLVGGRIDTPRSVSGCWLATGLQSPPDQSSRLGAQPPPEGSAYGVRTARSSTLSAYGATAANAFVEGSPAPASGTVPVLGQPTFGCRIDPRQIVPDTSETFRTHPRHRWAGRPGPQPRLLRGLRVEEAGVALRVVSMEELKLEVLLEPERTGDEVAAVSAVGAGSRGRAFIAIGAGTLSRARPGSSRARAGLAHRRRRSSLRWRRASSSCAGAIRAWGHGGSRPSSRGRGSARRQWQRSTVRSSATT
jgi:hypothetical protein